METDDPGVLRAQRTPGSLVFERIFLGRTVRAPQVRRAEASSKTKVYHVIPIRPRDEVEAPITDWLAEAYELQDAPAATA